MNQKDIDIFLQAKKQQKNIHRVFIFAALLIPVYYLFLLNGVNFNISEHNVITFYVVIVASYFTSQYSGNKKVITRSHLLHVIENLINKDAKALEYISEKNER